MLGLIGLIRTTGYLSARQKCSSRSGDVDGDGIYDLTDDIQIDCGCSAGVDAEEYYPCQEYVSVMYLDIHV